MKKTTLIFLVIILLIIAGYLIMRNNTNDDLNANINSNEPPVAFSTDSYAVFSKNYNSQFLGGYNGRYTPSTQDIEKGLSVIEAFLDKQSGIRNLSEYKIQFVGYTNDKGEKILYANYFCGDYFTEWKTNFIMVEDGGNCYFNLKVNLDTEDAFDFYINGDA